MFFIQIRAVLIYHYRTYNNNSTSSSSSDNGSSILDRGMLLSWRQTAQYYWSELILLLGLREMRRDTGHGGGTGANQGDEQNRLPMEFTMAEIEYQVG